MLYREHTRLEKGVLIWCAFDTLQYCVCTLFYCNAAVSLIVVSPWWEGAWLYPPLSESIKMSVFQLMDREGGTHTNRTNDRRPAPSWFFLCSLCAGLQKQAHGKKAYGWLVALSPFRVRWVSWLGGVVDPAIQPAVRKKLEADHNCTPVFLTQEVRRHGVEHCIMCGL